MVLLNKKLFLKILLYIILIYFGFTSLVGLLAIPFFIIFSIDSLTNNTSGSFLDFNIFIFETALILSCPLSCYFIAKIFGIYKYIDSLNSNFKKGLWLGFISLFTSVIVCINIAVALDKDFIYFSLGAFGFIPGYFLYKFFRFLTKKYPVPFERIGYWCSGKFWVEVFKGIVKRIKINT